VKHARSEDTQPGRVAVNFGAACLIETDAGVLVRCHMPRRLTGPVCGDYVRWSPAASPGMGVINEVLARRNELLRHDVRSKLRVMAANIDQLLVVLAAAPEPDLALIDRYLVAAELLKLTACLVFNKTDLLDNDGQWLWAERLAPYAKLGYHTVFACMKDGSGIAEIRRLLRDQTGVVVGQSGVGKSSLVSALVPDLVLRTQRLSEASGAGQHTTSHTRLYRLPEERSCIIDSPGVRDFRLWPVSQQELAAGFREFREALGRCRFADCRHLREPGCEIRARVDSGAISPRRYASYCQLLEWAGKTLS
jgi:ribosome biogenesis GTPase